MSSFTPFDILSVPLRGTHLIEASAGTGKTFTICNLVLRLVAEEGMDIGRILAVTFTEAATRELRDRIRNLFSQAQLLVDGPEPADNSVAAAVIRQAVAVRGRQAVSKALRKAVLSFDEAGIFTIHGFCNRILNQFAFESSLQFNTELVTDQSRLVREVVDDFWRLTLNPGPRLLCVVALKRKLSPDELVGFSGILINKPTLKLVPQVPVDPQPALIAAFEAICRRWQTDRDRIVTMLRENPRLSRDKKAYRIDVLEEYAAGMDRLADGDIDPAGLACIDRFTPESMAKNAKSSRQSQGLPDHPFFHLCEDYARAEETWESYYRHEFRRYLERELSRRKQENHVQYFSDLLSGLHQALASDSRGALAAAIREKYQAALIDEFQDTDPIQYDIFNTLFSAGAHRLFLIGDPKQSIFAFRSADIFSYIRASTRVEAGGKHALPWNWRSETDLVQAVNHLFGQAVNPFVLGESIGFNPVAAAADNVGNRSPLRIDGGKAGAIELWFLRKEDAGGKAAGALSREEARPAAVNAVADEIASLLNRSAAGEVLIGEAPLRPSDMAVLITRNEDAGPLRNRLAILNIPAVISRAGSVFSTEDAREVERLLLAMAAPADVQRVNAALSGGLIGCSAADIQEFMEDDARSGEYERHLRQFAAYHELWRSWGFIHAFRRFLSDYHVRARLLAQADGERRLTNVLHLSELIHRAAVKYRLGENGVLSWMAERRAAREETADEEQLRLERDDEAVRIVTVWKSKGLQYPVVFCPFMWTKGATSKEKKNDVIFHDGHDLTLDIGPRGVAHIQAAGRENLSELIRLLYVAVTRAVNRCYLVYGRIGDPARSGVTALDYVLTGGRSADSLRLEDIESDIKAMKAEELYQVVAERIGDADDLIRLTLHKPSPARPYRPKGPGERMDLKRRVFPGDRIDQEWGISSFTHLTARSREMRPETDDSSIKRDEFSVLNNGDQRLTPGIFFDFPAGPATGLCLHSIFEKLDFSLSVPADARRLIDAALIRYGLDKPNAGGISRGGMVYRMIQNVLRAPLLPQDSQFSLSVLSPESRIHELEFYYPVRRITPARLRAVMKRLSVFGDGRHQIFLNSSERFDFRPLHGYMRGFIDLVFVHNRKYYLLDWKTNHLGSDYRNYDSPGLSRCVAEASYFLQYYIYTVALQKYLESRLPDYDYDVHFGGVVYLFVRGVTPDIPGSGVYFDRPAGELVKELSEVLG